MRRRSITKAAKDFLHDQGGLGTTDYLVIAAVILIVYPHVVYPGALNDFWSALVRLFS
jgi:hypothetical protein